MQKRWLGQNADQMGGFCQQTPHPPAPYAQPAANIVGGIGTILYACLISIFASIAPVPKASTLSATTSAVSRHFSGLFFLGMIPMDI